MGRPSKKPKKTNVRMTRKEQRKEKRQQKKENKRNFFAKKKTKSEKQENISKQPQVSKNDPTGGEDVNSEVESDFELSDDEINTKLNQISNKSLTAQSKPKPSPVATIKPDRFLENQQREKKKQMELQKKMRKRRIEQLKNANEDDDKIIKRLEKKLRIDKHRNEKSVHKMFNDGLDYALELCLPDNIEKMYRAAKDAVESEESDDAFGEDLAMALGESSESKKAKKTKREQREKTKEEKRINKLTKAEAKYFQDESDLSGTDSEMDDHSDDASRGEKGVLNDSEDSDFDIVPSDEEAENDLEEHAEQNDSDSSSEDENSETEHGLREDDVNSEMDDEENSLPDGKENSSNTWEDIYGRKRDKEGNIIEDTQTKYIPPHVRARMETGANIADEKRREKLANLQRHCKGFLNRLSETNIQKIASDIENLYRSNSRFDMNNTLTRLISEALISNVLTPERMVLEYAMLVAILHAHVGNEIGAHFLQEFIRKIDKHMKEIETLDVENKEFDNSLFFLSHLYTFKVFQHSLVYELLTRLTEKLCEKSVECLLLVLRSIGFQLRKDDPLALKELIVLIQKRASEAPLQIKENPRLKFMIEVLLAIKNNNMTKIPQYDPSLAEHLKKILKATMTNGKYVTTLNITMGDLLSADEKGKWWVVGSAWSGNIKDIKAAAQKSNKPEAEKFSDQLLTLAKQQRMNTEDRKNVFCIVMSAEDYINAFERLLHLSIRDQRVVVSVTIHCCLSEKNFNPYYAALAQKFCEYDRKYQLAMQFALWDRIKELRSASKQESRNLAQLLVYLILKGGQPLSVLKIVEFAEMDKDTLRFVRQIMLGLLLAKEDEFYQVFLRIAPSAKLVVFKDSLRLFMRHFLLKGAEKTVEADKIELLKHRVRMADEALQSRDSKVKF